MRQPVPFGKYLLLDRVSVGGMAEIFKAKSYGVEGFEKIIAIKRILPSMGEDREFIKMFIDEAKIVGLLNHANICQIFELGRIDGTHFISMEYIWGKDLLQIQNRLKKNDQLMPPAMACHVIARVCEGLDYAHRKRDPMGNELKIVHRDCSPQNVLVSYEGEVKIIDFGIAKAASRSSRTMAGVLKGKFGYMSPEQVRGLPLDRRSDIFALGTVFYEILTRERLFQAESDFSTLEKVRNVDIVPPREVNADIPEAVEAIVMKALAPDPDDRYQWCGEMLGDLQKFLMSQEAVYTSKNLSAWMKESFAGELARERRLMEEYKQLGRDGLIAGKPQAEAEAEIDVVEELGEAGEPEGDPTILGGPSFEEILGAPPQAEDDDSIDFAEEAPTEIFGEVETHDEPGDRVARLAEEMAQPTIQASGLADASVSAKTLLQPSGSAAVRASSAMGTPSPPPFPGMHGQGGIQHLQPGLGGGAPGQALPQAHFGDSPFGITASVARLPASDSRSRGSKPSLLKDILIGVGIALLVLGLFAGVKLVFFSSARPAATSPSTQLAGSIEVSVPAGKRGSVLVDSRPVGDVSGEQPRIVSGLALGAHAVEVVQPGARPCQATVTLDQSNTIRKVECPLEPLLTQLVIEGVTAAHDVQINGRSVDKEQRGRPLALEPGTIYDITVALEGRQVDRFTVKLDPGETVRRELPADPGAAARSPGDGNGREPRSSQDQDEERGRPPERDPGRDERRDEDRDRGEEQGERRDSDGVGYLVANSTPWAKVTIDGRDTGMMTPIAPRNRIPLAPGKHRVTFVYQGQKFSFPVTIEKGKTAKLIKTLPVAGD